MMQTTSPVDSDVTFIAIKTRSALHTTSGTDTAKFEQTIKDGTVITDIVFALLFRKRVHIVGSDLGEEVDILVRMELGHLIS